MDELKTNTTLRIAAIAFAIFVVVSTVLIFAFPENASTPGESSLDIPTISAANQTRIAASNATALAGTATPQPGSRAPVPASEIESRRQDRSFTADPSIDRTINLLESSVRYDAVNDIARAQITCGAESAAAAPCNGSPPGTVVDYFVAIGCSTDFVTDDSIAQEIVKKTLEKHPAWVIGAVIQEGIPRFTSNGFAVALRAGAGNTGTSGT